MTTITMTMIIDDVSDPIDIVRHYAQGTGWTPDNEEGLTMGQWARQKLREHVLMKIRSSYLKEQEQNARVTAISTFDSVSSNPSILDISVS